MKTENPILQKLKRPKGWFLVLIYLLTLLFGGGAIALAVIGAVNKGVEILSYVLYGCAAVALTYTVYTIVIYAPGVKSRLTAWIKKTAFGRRLLEQYGFRTIVFAGCSLFVSLAYVAFHVVLAIVAHSFWYGSLALYYGLLVVLRGGIVLYHRKKRKAGVSEGYEKERTEIAKYRTCGILLTVIPLCLVVPILQIIFLDRAFVHQGWTVFAFAAYAFYKIIMAVYNVFKSRKQEDMTVRAVRCVGVADAMVSIFSLQTALLFAFAEGNYRVANALTGSAVCLLTIALGVFMTVDGCKRMRLLKAAYAQGENREEGI